MAQTRHFIMRHGETVYNRARVLQSNTIHTPLTTLGCEQARAMGRALAKALAGSSRVQVHVSDAGRAQQTWALIADELGHDWFDAHVTPDLREIDMGSWCGRSYDAVEAEVGPIRLPGHLLQPAPDGEDYRAIAARLQRWREGPGAAAGDHVVVMHGISSRVLRGMMTGLPAHPVFGVGIAPSLVQGSIALIEGARETLAWGSAQGTEHA